MKKVSTGDDMRTILKGIMKERKLSVNAWSRLAGASEGTMRFFLSGTNDSLKVSTLERYLSAIGMTLKDLGIENITKVLVSGYVGGDAEISSAKGAKEEVDMPLSWRGLPMREISALKVADDYVLPLIRKNWVIYFHEKNNITKCHKKLCVITLDDKRRYVKELEKGAKPGFYTLRGHNSAAIENVKVVSAFPIISIEPN